MVKLISNRSQAWVNGATWGNPAGDNEQTQFVSGLLNGTGLTLYTGDIVCLDVTGTQAILPASAGDPAIIGTVGGAEEWGSYFAAGATTANLNTVAGGPLPPVLSPNVVANMGFTGASATVTYAGAAAQDLGKNLIPAYNSTTNANAQVYTIIAVTPGTGYTVNQNFNGTTGTFTTSLQLSPSSVGPGFQPITIAPFSEAPIVTKGIGRVNINGVAAVVAKDAIQATSGAVVGARTANGSLTAAQIGQSIATTLEAYAARDTTLTGLGITGHDSVRALIGKF